MTKNIESVTRDVYREYLLTRVIPAIKEKWPKESKGDTIFIQQDNATPHVLLDDPEVVFACTADGWNIRMLCQPPNSPDMNVLDLGFFASIQALQYRAECKSIRDLLREVNAAFHALPVEKLDDVFLTLQKVLECVMKAGGSNKFKLPHARKKKLRKEGTLPVSFGVDAAVVYAAQQLIADKENELANSGQQSVASKVPGGEAVIFV